jgi:hypothetical protein
MQTAGVGNVCLFFISLFFIFWNVKIPVLTKRTQSFPQIKSFESRIPGAVTHKNSETDQKAICRLLRVIETVKMITFRQCIDKVQRHLSRYDNSGRYTPTHSVGLDREKETSRPRGSHESAFSSMAGGAARRLTYQIHPKPSCALCCFCRALKSPDRHGLVDPASMLRVYEELSCRLRCNRGPF